MILKRGENRLTLSNHLWNSQAQPLELPETARPPQESKLKERPKQQLLDTLLNHANNLHPDLIKLQTKDEQLAIERTGLFYSG